MPRPLDAATLAELKAVGGDGSWIESVQDQEPYLVDFRRLYRGVAALILLPRDAAQVSRMLAVCNQKCVPVVPQGGNTGYVGGATPDESGAQIVMSLQRLDKVRHLDAANDSMIVEAGVTLARAQSAADKARRLFPLSLGSEGSAQIGGNISTNAGGTAVLRYGMMRDLVLGLEVVLADGRILNGLKSLRKDNTGYDLKSLFIGAEGTLGVITAASLKLFPSIAASATALVGIRSPQAALDLLLQLRVAAADRVTTFEIMPRYAVELAVEHIAGVADPLDFSCPWFALVELTSSNAGEPLEALLEAVLAQCAEQGDVADAMLATSLGQAQAMWQLREFIPEAQRRHGASLKHDVSVPISAIPALLERGTALSQTLVPEGAVLAYGHAGDGNLHFNVSQKPGSDTAAFLSRAPRLETALFDLVESLGGSISAEHGIGRLKARQFAQRADPVELAVMHAVKRALDPNGIMNPGKVLCAS